MSGICYWHCLLAQIQSIPMVTHSVQDLNMTLLEVICCGTYWSFKPLMCPLGSILQPRKVINVIYWKATGDFWEFYVEQYREVADKPARQQCKRRWSEDCGMTCRVPVLWCSFMQVMGKWNPEVAHLSCTLPRLCTLCQVIPRLCTYAMQSQDCALCCAVSIIGTQFPDSECNFEIVQIPGLHGTHLLAY